MAEQIPGSRLALIPNAAHLANLEQPDAFNQILITFASELDK
jgi:pimeloyl-ACP methyl ester carboxylesterase